MPRRRQLMLAINESKANMFIDNYPILIQIFLSVTHYTFDLGLIHFHRIQIDSKTVFKTYELLINTGTSKVSGRVISLMTFSLGENKIRCDAFEIVFKSLFLVDLAKISSKLD
jgi:hypothetical protein